MTVSTRRVALGAILAAPLVSMPAAAATPSVSVGLARLIAKHDRINAMLNASADPDDLYYDKGLIRAASAMRARVVAYHSRGLPDVLAKVSCLARLWPLEDLKYEVAQQAASGGCYIDGMAQGIVLELAMMVEGGQCA